MASAALVERIVDIRELRCVKRPVVERALQRRGNPVGDGGRAQIARDDDQLTVA
jgi:hypothetical protein